MKQLRFEEKDKLTDILKAVQDTTEEEVEVIFVGSGLDQATLDKRVITTTAEKLGKKRSLLILSSLGLDEIWFALLGILTRIELRNRKLEEKRWFWFLKENPEFVSTLAGELEKKTTFLLEIPFLFLIEISHESTLKSLNIMKQYGLLPRDAIHATAAMVSGVDTIITTDEDFSRVDKLTIYTCNPKSLHYH